MGFRKIGDPQVMVGFNTTMVVHDLDDLGYPPDLETSMWVCDDIITFGYFCLLYLLFKEQCVYCYLLYVIGKIFSYLHILTLDCRFLTAQCELDYKAGVLLEPKNDTNIILLK